jgi:hypothetical protein
VARGVVLPILLAASPAFAIDNLIVAGSAALDYRYVSGNNPPSNPSLLGITSLGLEVAAKAVVDVGHGVSFTVKACGGCHGLELDQAYGEVMVRDFFNVRLGRINVPFGEFNTRHDPANFSTPSKPLPYAMGDMLFYGPQAFNLGIVPAPYVDNGLEVYGTLAFANTAQLDYSVYGVKGLSGTNDLDFAASRRYLDNNRLPSFGARLVLNGPDWAVGASASGGTYDDRDRLVYLMGGVELYFRAGPLKFRAEALGRRTDLDPNAQGYPFALVDAWFLKVGWYAQVDLEVQDRLTLVLRSDGLHRLGMPLPFSQVASASAGMQRQTLALMFRVTSNLALKLDYELWTFSGFASEARHAARAAAVFAY